MRPSYLLYILAAALFTSCASASQEATATDTAVALFDKHPAADTATTVASSSTLKPQSGPYTPECYKAITDIVLSSSFKTDAAKKENIKVRIDRQENSKLFIQLFANENDHESTLAWLRLDKASEKLEDITVDPDKPTLLTYDKGLINELRQHCP